MSKDQPECEYARVQISGTLICKTDLHVGDGDLESFKKFLCPNIKQQANEEKENEAGSYNTVYKDHKQLAYIPGSTLRGALTAFLNEDDKTVEKLFGYEKPASEDREGERLAGKVRVFDAHIAKSIDTDSGKMPYWNPHSGTFIGHGIALDDVTGTAEKGKLFRYELVPAGTQFAVEIEADHLAKEELATLLGLLTRWNGASETAIGKGTSKGYGRIEWQPQKTSVLSKDALRKWADSNTLDKPAYDTIELDAIDVSALIQKQTRYQFSIHIYPQSPLLCNEPGFVTGIEQEPTQVFFSRDGKAVIPGSTLAGVARARGRRILMTLLHQANPEVALVAIAKQAKALIDQLFGNEDQQSALEFSDATDTATATVKHPQYFNAIDRFTGGAKDRALFNVIAAQCDELNTETCYLNLDRMPEDGDWWKGLLLFIARDAIEGELAVGWGKGKGYGSLIAALDCKNEKMKNWDDLLAALSKDFGEGEAENWIKALLEKTKILSIAQGAAP